MKIPELMAVEFYLQALESGNLRATHGRHTHASFFSMLNNVSSELVTKLHNSNSEKPFTVSCLYNFNTIMEKSETSEKSIFIKSDEIYCFRVTAITEELCAAIFQLFRINRIKIKIGNINFIIKDVAYADRKRAGIETYTGLMEYINRQPKRSFGLQFISPTAFHSKEQNFLFPLPSFIFPRLLKRWNQFCPEDCIINYNQFSENLEYSIMVSDYKLQTKILDFGPKGQEVAFIGYCGYKAARKSDIKILQILQVLLRFVFFAGIGYGTPRGMGQVDFIFV